MVGGCDLYTIRVLLAFILTPLYFGIADNISSVKSSILARQNIFSLFIFSLKKCVLISFFLVVRDYAALLIKFI